MSAAKLRTVAAIAILVVLGVAPAAHASAHRDGELVYSWFNREESDLDPAVPLLDESAIRAIAPQGGEPRTLRGCTKAAGRVDVGDCSISYRDPAVSPGGRWVAFDAGVSLALMRIGGGFRLLPAHGEDDGDPAFSPDGTRLAFSTGAGTAVFDPTPDRGVWISDLAGAGARRVTARGISPAWSSRGWIAFLRADGVYRVRPDGHGLRRLVARTLCSDVAWSPSGTRLAFACRSHLYVARGGGRHVRSVLARDDSATAVAWSPAGTRLAVVPFDGGVVTMRPDGTGRRGVVDGGYSSMGALGAGGVAWRPRFAR